MIAKSLTFTFFFFLALIAMQWLFSAEVNWLDIIGMSFMVFLIYILFSGLINAIRIKIDGNNLLEIV